MALLMATMPTRISAGCTDRCRVLLRQQSCAIACRCGPSIQRRRSGWILTRDTGALVLRWLCQGRSRPSRPSHRCRLWSAGMHAGLRMAESEWQVVTLQAVKQAAFHFSATMRTGRSSARVASVNAIRSPRQTLRLILSQVEAPPSPPQQRRRCPLLSAPSERSCSLRRRRSEQANTSVDHSCAIVFPAKRCRW